MVLINIKSGKCFSNVCKAEASRLIGVNTKTIYNWSKKTNIERYNNWVIYFDEEIKKQNKGFKKR